MLKPQRKFMEEAIRQAKLAYKRGDYAIGAVIVKGGKIIAKAANRTKIDENPIAHAEIMVIEKASKVFDKRHLTGCILYTTNEPCPMCTSVVVWAKIKGVVYGSRMEDMKDHREDHGNKHYLWRTIEIPCEEVFRKSTEKIKVFPDFMREECIKLFHS